MKLKTPEIEIPIEEPFKNDLLGRKNSAEALTELICSTEEPLVLSVNASWGQGKTTFLNMWRQMLSNKGVKTLYFNAWENDFTDDAFVSLMGELELGINELSLTSSDEPKAQLQKAKKFAASLMKRSIPTAVKLATAGLIDLDELSEEALAEYGEKLAEEQVKRYEDSKKSVVGFKKALTALAENVATDSKFPLVILIDELDRCRPPYAIRVLEAVKHFFSVQKVVFVLALDQQQLGHSIRTMYGSSMDVAGYLRRFIDIDYSLPLPKKGTFCREQFIRFGITELFNRRNAHESKFELRNVDGMFSELFEILGCTLREQERCFTLLSLAIRTTPENYQIHPYLLSALIILKVKENNLYQDFVSGKKDYRAILEYIGAAPSGEEFLSGHLGTVLEAYLVSCKPRQFDFDKVSLTYRELAQKSPDELAKQRAEKLIKILESIGSDDSFGILDYVVHKIDLISHFK